MAAHRPTQGERLGKVGIGTLLFVAAVALAIFVATRVIPVWGDDWDLKQILVASIDNAAIKSDAQIRNDVNMRAANLGSHMEDDGWGNKQVVKGLALTDEQLVIERDTVRRTIRITALYDRAVPLNPLPKTLTLHFQTSQQLPLR